MFKIAKKIDISNQDITGEQCIKNNYVLLVDRDEEKKIAWKSYHASLSNKEFAWGRNSLSQADTVVMVPWLTNKDTVRGSTSMMKNGKAFRPSSVMPEILKEAGKTGVDIITGLVNQILKWNELFQ